MPNWTTGAHIATPICSTRAETEMRKMGTRALTYIHNSSDEAPFCAIYRQFDGYPDTHGAEIFEAIGSKKLVNGISGDRDSVVNGMGCAAAQLIKSLKDEAGGIYIEAPTTEPAHVSYIYRLAAIGEPRNGGAVHLRVTRCYDDITLYDGPLSAFDAATCEKQAAED
jgi:hypothetical protein